MRPAPAQASGATTSYPGRRHGWEDLRTPRPVEIGHPGSMTDREDFLAWIHGALYDAELALHNGDPGPRRALWSRSEPVSVLGAWRNANGLAEVDELFTHLGASFSN